MFLGEINSSTDIASCGSNLNHPQTTPGPSFPQRLGNAQHQRNPSTNSNSMYLYHILELYKLYPILERFSCVQGTLCGYFQKKQCAGPVAPWVWRHLRRAFNFDSMIVVLRLHPGPCCLACAPGAEHCPFDWGGAFTFCFFVACLCFPLLFSYLFAPRFFWALRPSLPRERNHAVSHPCGPKFVTFKS